MADSKNDNLEDKNNLEYEYYNYDDNEMYTMYLKNRTGAKIKIDKADTSVLRLYIK